MSTVRAALAALALSALVCERGLLSALRRKRGARDVDLVVERHCESVEWLSLLSSDVRARTKVFIYDKPGKECAPVNASSLPADLQVTIKELPNVARDGHDQLQHIIDHREELSTHVAFVQAGLHWTLMPRIPKTRGWTSQADALNVIIPKLSNATRFLPLVMQSNKGPVQWMDMEDDTDSISYAETNIQQFKTGASDMWMRTKEVYAMFFGGTPCQAPPQKFTAGMQYIVHRDSILRRPPKFWKAFQDLMVSCDPGMGYAFERITTAVYNSSAVAVDPDTWRNLTFCTKGVSWKDFSTPLRRVESAEFWRRRWGCEPLSQRLLTNPDFLEKQAKWQKKVAAEAQRKGVAEAQATLASGSAARTGARGSSRSETSSKSIIENQPEAAGTMKYGLEVLLADSPHDSSKDDSSKAAPFHGALTITASVVSGVLAMLSL